MSAGLEHRKISWAKVVILWVVALGAVGSAILLMLPETPPVCATDISIDKAQALFEQALREKSDDLRIGRGLTEAEIRTFKIRAPYRSDEDNWPTYFVRGEGIVAGARKVIIAIGNGCGFGEIQDLSQGPTDSSATLEPSEVHAT